LKADQQTIRKAMIALGKQDQIKDVIAARSTNGTLEIWLRGHKGQAITWSPTGEAAQETRPVPPVKDERD